MPREMTTTIRIPARLAFYMDATGWGQRAEPVSDMARMRLLKVLAGPVNADGSYSVRDPGRSTLARLWYEADHLMDSYRYGDHDPDTLADYNAGRAMKRRITKHLGRDWRAGEVADRLYEATGVRT